MTRALFSATSIGCNWVMVSICSTASAINVGSKVGFRLQQDGRFLGKPRRLLDAMATLRSRGLCSIKAVEDRENMPVVFGYQCVSRDEELKVVQRDLEEYFPRRWVHEVRTGEVKVLTKFRSRYNLVQVLDISRDADSVLAGSRVLLLDRPGNIHSMQFTFKALTNTYYDVFASLPPLLPPGPVGIYGLGAGTAARLLHHFWPSLQMHGWELDVAVVAAGRRYFSILDLEAGKPSDLPGEDEHYGGDGDNKTELGKLVVHVGDALSSSAVVEGGFGGIIVDLFSEGKVIPALQQPSVWQEIKDRLKPGGRIMVNAGGSCVEAEDKTDGKATMEQTLKAIKAAFPGEVSTKTLEDNCMALTGPFPDFTLWKRQLPRCLQDGVSDWRPV